jgi:hypothetical protein
VPDNVVRVCDACLADCLFDAFAAGDGSWHAWPDAPAGTESWAGRDVGGRHIRARHLGLIEGLSCVQWFEDGGGRNKALHFKFRTVAGEGQGLVMGMSSR